MVDDLPRLGSGVGETQAVDHVVQAPLEELKQVLAGDAFLLGSLIEILLKLALQDAVDGPGPLLLPELNAMLGDTAAA